MNYAPNSYGSRIFAYKSFGRRILQAHFANPAPSRAFKREGGGVYPKRTEIALPAGAKGVRTHIYLWSEIHWLDFTGGRK
jgi:hypothetical protein